MLRKVLATVVAASIAGLGIAAPKYEGNELFIRQNHGGRSISVDGMNLADRCSSADYEDIWHQPLPPVMKGEASPPPPPQGTAVPNTCTSPAPHTAQDV